jgi:hypothetical protein
MGSDALVRGKAVRPRLGPLCALAVLPGVAVRGASPRLMVSSVLKRQTPRTKRDLPALEELYSDGDPGQFRFRRPDLALSTEHRGSRFLPGFRCSQTNRAL